MEARSAINGAAVSKTFIVAILAIVAVGLGVMGAYLASNLSGSKAATHSQTTQPANSQPNVWPLRVS